MQNRLFLPLMMIAVVGAQSGCAAAPAGPSPSLAKRPIEKTWNVPNNNPPPEAPGPLPADLAGRLARWASEARAGDAAFQAARPTTEQLVAAAAGTAVASEKWVVGQQALSRLYATRAPVTGALADIDRLYIDRRDQSVIDGLPAIYALRAQLAEMVAAEDLVLDRLQTQIRKD